MKSLHGRAHFPGRSPDAEQSIGTRIRSPARVVTLLLPTFALLELHQRARRESSFAIGMGMQLIMLARIDLARSPRFGRKPWSILELINQRIVPHGYFTSSALYGCRAATRLMFGIIGGFSTGVWRPHNRAAGHPHHAVFAPTNPMNTQYCFHIDPRLDIESRKVRVARTLVGFRIPKPSTTYGVGFRSIANTIMNKECPLHCHQDNWVTKKINVTLLERALHCQALI